MIINPEIKRIGQELVEGAEREEEFSAQRGLVDELFPYIYRASKRMSTRAISRWLKEQQNISLSAVTIAKALRESERYWVAFLDEVEPAAEIVARAHDIACGRRLLEDEELFVGVTGSTPTLSGIAAAGEYEDACETVRNNWFQVLDAAGREECLAVVGAAERREEKAESVKNEPRKK